MKKRFVFFIMTVVLLFAAPLVIFCQDVQPPASIVDLLTNLNMYLGSMIGVAAMTTFLGALLNGLLKVTKPFVKQLLVWVVAIVILVVSNLVNVGYGKEFTIWQSLLHGFGAGLIANGIFDVPIVKAIVEFFEKLLNKPSA